ncbi:MAG: DUF5671 domain-containing protein [Patescibacteria group bacterium]|jgi:hypothetical protein
MSRNDSAKYAFFYVLSLVALIFMSISVGIVIFQIINKQIVDIINDYMINYNDGAMKFAISAIIVSAPIYYLTSRQIFKSLFAGILDKDAGVRKWLTYFILLVSVVVMIGFLIATINNFLDGDLTTKFILKALTALIIAGAVFYFYFYDIRREEVQGKKDKMISIFAWASIVVVTVVFIASWFTVDSPAETRSKKIDTEVINNLSEINSAIVNYFTLNDTMPSDLSVLMTTDSGYRLTEQAIKQPSGDKYYDYQVTSDNEYKICADFLTSNLNDDSDMYYFNNEYKHDKGYQCFSQNVVSVNNSKTVPAPVMMR